MPFRRLIGNKVSEKEVREWFDEHGFIGDTARFAELELHAIQRPGWLQIYRFEVTVTSIDESRLREIVFGAMRADDRYGPPEILIYRKSEDRDSQLAAWSEGLITQRRHRKNDSRRKQK